jgi:hypothetical protein
VVTDGTGAVLPGVTVTLTSPALITPQTSVTGGTGAYRFPNIPIGVYTVTFEIEGFTRLVNEGVRIETGFNAQINRQLQVSALQETVTVEGASPVLDVRSTTTGQTYTREMLERIPTARDPWVVMEQTPGIIMSSQNVGGNKSGQQTTFVAHGTGSNEVWNVDGGNITDQASESSSIYYDFDAFEEIQIQTGGSDASVQSSGVSINLITKSGGNAFHGSSRFFVVDDNLQGDNISAELRAQNAGSGNPVKNIRDYGFEVGGPIMRNKAWFWTSYGVNDIEVGVVGFTRPGGDPTNRDDLINDVTNIKTYNGKLQYQWSQPHKTSFLYVFNDKFRGTRDAGPLRPPETTFRQIQPISTFRLSHQWIPSDRLSLDAQVTTMPNGGFRLELQDEGLKDVQASLDLATQMNGRSARWQDNRRPQKEVRLDGNYFLEGFLGGNNAMKFGAGWRDSSFGFTGIRGGGVTARFTNGRATEADIYRNSNTETGQYQTFGYVQNAHSRGRLTLNTGVRFDHQYDTAKASSVAANALLPDLLPAVTFSGTDSGVRFANWSPRFGVTWDLASNGKTVIKGNAAVYYGTAITTAQYVNPVLESRIRFPWNDANSDGFVQRNELNLNNLLDFAGNYDPANPASQVSSTGVDPNLKNDRTDEVTAGIEREIGQGFAVEALYIFRNYPRYENFTPANGVSSADYFPTTATFACGNASCDQPEYTITYFELPFTIPGASTRRNADRTRKYRAVELTLRKRFSDRWMMNASANIQTTAYHYGGPDVSYQDPTEIDRLDGAQAGTANARWFAKLTGLYVIPWQDIGISGFLNTRQGYPYNRRIQTPTRRGGIGRFEVDIDRYGDARYEDFAQLDLRVEKQFPWRTTKWIVSLDVFNVFNAATVLTRQGILNNTTANNATEVLGPRVARFGLRFNF